MKIIHTDALVLGGGLAGLRTAIGMKKRGHEVISLSLVPPKRSHSSAAQGGMQASLANSVKGIGDNEDLHFVDTIKGSDWGADQQVVRMFVDTAPKAVRELAAWGVPWNRIEKGDQQSVIDGKKVILTEPENAHGLITARNFGGTQKWRTCYVADGTGHSMLYTMSNQAIANDIPVHERMEALSLIHDGKQCFGAIARNLISGELVVYIAKVTCIATGGFGRIYRSSTNAVINEGIGAALALETGIASLGNMEAVQFHPTAIFPAGILVTEGCRGDGGLLLDVNLHRFMADYEPEKKELASRDVVSRWMETHIAKGYGVKSRFGEHLWLDIRLLGEHHINTKLREVKEICQYFLGIDPVKDLIPVRPAQHYSMGGVRTNHKGQSPSLLGLYSCGEAACWDMHGFNRLGGNSVAETVVAGMIVGEYMADFLDSNACDINISTALITDFYEKEKNKLAAFYQESNTENPFEIMSEMQNIMTKNVAIFRNKTKLVEAIEQLKALRIRAKNIRVHSNAKGTNPELVAAYRVQKMLKLSLCTTYGALQREESRGAHSREDFPLRDDKRWLNRTLATWPCEQDELPTLQYEPINIKAMEMPPSWRGYGAKDRIDHPDTAIRLEEVEKIKKENNICKDSISKGIAAKDIEAQDKEILQTKLMPYKHLLPEKLRGKNARLSDEQ
ncbi:MULTISPECIES: fumarate reductase flavoprotein subunit [unclassified Colwellia]|uniref:fumarate reductase flavoprotein subunit n=1 Tax=unclassified Colwellia TaxID=196834 RepID=UPI0015F5F7D6|nr:MULTISPECIES: fumarate reductase flavoprotein subunit [unclassified Colwellia]MBA6379853.1 fumarate reductase flavoprotein subunit [Colwellia sp. BRX10-7]MBA6386577.1 fumarate reductase flavoprotein subunit [Colwellia sp. BRX10-2]MBA6401687.1 fumarate reductase flavoprotein subunit [Colwellia sp. BRX10-5]MBA6406278.1 fumarate reductase flavoprotein subunit [Colwellia sp. BRX10-1]